MNISAPFIHRPIATTLIALGIFVAGIIAYHFLPVAPLPQIDFPTISVQATLPGASPEVMASSVATPLERQIGHIAGVTEITSSSSLGQTQIIVQFDLSRNIDGAARDIQAAINAAQSQLPSNLPSLPTYRKVNPAEAPIMIITLTSNVASRGQMYDAASSILQQKISQIAGIGQVLVGGSSLPAIRLELNPTQLNNYGIGLEQVRNVISSQNNHKPLGNLIINDNNVNLKTNDQLFEIREYQPLIIAYRNNAPVQVKDVAEVTESVEDIRTAGLSDGKPAVVLILYKQPGANIIDTVNAVYDSLDILKASIPVAIDLTVTMDRKTTIQASLSDVEKTILIATGLVIAVVYFFLGNVRAAIIPSITIPLSLLGTVGIMYLLGFSLNNLSLMALTIVTGFVVDDAVVVLENISRHIESGQGRFQAALSGAKEVAFTVISMSTSLIAIFIPLLFMGGVVGRLLREFSVTLSVAILMSLFISLTISPMMCSRILISASNGKNNSNGNNNSNDKGTNGGTTGFVFWVRERYGKSLEWGLLHPMLMIMITFFAVGLTIYLYVIVPKGFFPQQDTGRIVASIQADQDMSFQAMQQKLSSIVQIVKQDPGVEHVVGFIGSVVSGGNTGRMFITLKPLNERKLTSDEIINRLREKLLDITGARVYMQSSQDIVVGGRQTSAQFQYTLIGDHLEDLRHFAPRITEKLSNIPGIIDVNSDLRDLGLQSYVTIDRDTASRFNISTQLIDNTLYDAFGQRQISIMYTPMNQYHVVMEVAPQFWQSPESLNDIYIPSSTNTSTIANPIANTNTVAINNISNNSRTILSANHMAPLSTFASFVQSSTYLAVNHTSQFPSVTISFNLQPGFALGDAVNSITDAMNSLRLSDNIHGIFTGTVDAFKKSLASEPLLIMTALMAVYIVLGMLYESLTQPVTILSTLPTAGVGALLALILTGNQFDIIALIGIILLIGIVKKNAIMMIDFALNAERSEKISPEEAIYKAAVLRFRPIMMTTFAAMFAAIPLALDWGIGGELRRPLGVAIIGGLLVSQLLTLYTTPVIYLVIERYSRWARAKLREMKWLQNHSGLTLQK